jgi:putative two-component system response regulator
MHSYYDPAFLRCTRDICLYHHECWDGAGYPEGLRGKDIPFAARVMAICDFYDVFVSERVYKPAYPHEEAIRRIAEGAGTRFDPVMAALFVENAESFRPKPEAREEAPDAGVPV